MEDEFQNSTALLVKFGTILIAPDECIPPPSKKEILESEESAVEEYRKILRKFRKNGLIVIMSYCESVS